MKNRFYALEPSFFEIFQNGQKTDKSGVIYMSRPFHNRITRQNQSKNERATLKGSKIPLLGLDAKEHKNQKIRNEHPTRFCHIFQGQK